MLLDSSSTELSNANSALFIAQHSLPSTSVAKQSIIQEKLVNDRELLELNRELSKRKRNAAAQEKYRKKKAVVLEEQNRVVTYDTVGRPPKYIEYPNLLQQINDIVDGDNSAAASNRRRTEILGVTSMKHIKDELRERAISLSRSSVSNYTIPSKLNSIAARKHHTPANVRIDRIQNNQTKNHIDGHYCNTSQKYVRDLVASLKDQAVFISQDDKAKVSMC